MEGATSCGIFGTVESRRPRPRSRLGALTGRRQGLEGAASADRFPSGLDDPKLGCQQRLASTRTLTSLRNSHSERRPSEPGGVIHLFTQVLDGSRLPPDKAVSFNLVFLNIYDHGDRLIPNRSTAVGEARFVDSSAFRYRANGMKPTGAYTPWTPGHPPISAHMRYLGSAAGRSYCR